MKAQGPYPGAHLCAQIVYICSSLGKQSQKLDGTVAFLQPQYQAGEAWVTIFTGVLLYVTWLALNSDPATSAS